MKKFNIESISIRKLIILSLALPLIINLIFINVFFSANRAIKSAHNWALHSKEILADSKFLRENIAEVQKSVEEHFKSTKPSLDPDNFDRMTGFLELKSNSLLKKTADNPEGYQFILSLFNNINRLKELERNLSSIEPAHDILKEMAITANTFLEYEDHLDHERTITAKSSIDFEFNLVIFALIFTIIYFIGVIIVLRKSFFKTLNRIMKNLDSANSGIQMEKPLKLNSELSFLENEFFEVYQKLEERSLENEGFVYCVSHDLRSPLLNIQSFSKELIKSAEKTMLELEINNIKVPPTVQNLLDENKESLSFILISVGKITQIIESVLGLSRAGRIPINLQKLDLNKKLESIIKSIMTSIRDSNAKITVKELPYVCGDLTALNQIFQNLITNSIKYKDPDRDLAIEVGVDEKKSDQIFKAIYVKDNAVGIPENYLERIFLPFEQIKNRKIPGEGLGLSIVKKLVERLNGKVEVESKVGVGTIFTIYLRINCPE